MISLHSIQWIIISLHSIQWIMISLHSIVKFWIIEWRNIVIDW
jgi:hypothetical protein